MLVLMRKPSESIKIGRDVTVTVLNVQGSKVRIGITAPKHLRVDREELRERIEQERRELADVDWEE